MDDGQGAIRILSEAESAKLNVNLMAGQFSTPAFNCIDQFAEWLIPLHGDPRRLLFLGHHATMASGPITWSGGCPSPTCPARNEANFGWRPGEPTLVLIDRDIHADTAEEADRQLCAAVPEIGVINPRRFYKPSASSCIRNAQGVWVHRASKWHCWMAATDGAVWVKRLLQHIFIASYEKHGFAKLTRVSAESNGVRILDYSMVDPSVAQGSREIFEFGANILSPGWTQPHAGHCRMFGDPKVQMIDIERDFKQLFSMAEWRQHSTERKEIRDKLEPERQRLNAQLGVPQIARRMASGMSEADARAAVASNQTGTDTPLLDHFSRIILRDRVVSAGDSYTDPTLWSKPGEGFPCKDPDEPDYPNSQWPAKLYAGPGQHSGQAYISSWAHGGIDGEPRKYRLSKNPQTAFANAGPDILPPDAARPSSGPQMPDPKILQFPPSQTASRGPQMPSGFRPPVYTGEGPSYPAAQGGGAALALASPEARAAASWGLEQTGAAQPGATAPYAGMPGPRVIDATAFDLPDERDIPNRKWLYGKFYMRGETTGTYSPGGVGKTALIIAELLCQVSGMALLGVPVKRPLRVIYFGEESRDEITRRLAAACKHYRIDRDRHIADRLVIHSMRDERLTLVKTGDRNTFEPNTRDIDAVKAVIRAHRADIVFFDTMKKIHTVDENDNGAMDALVTELNQISHDCECSVMLLAHTKKTGGREASIDDARGGRAQLDALRAARMIRRMTEIEAKDLNIPKGEARLIIRIGDSKENLSPPADKSIWYKLNSVLLDNGRPFDTLENGEPDNVQAVAPFTPPKDIEEISEGERNDIREAVFDGGFWMQNYQAKTWVAYPIAKMLGLDIGHYGQLASERTKDQEENRKKINKKIAKLIADGVLEIYDAKNDNGMDKKYVRVKRPDA